MKKENFNIADTDGNKLTLEEGKLILTSVGGKRSMIGNLTTDPKDRIIYTKDEDEKNIFRKTNAWSINRLVLEHVDAIIYRTKDTRYTITRERAIENGQLLKFNNEEKYYVPLEFWKQAPMELKPLDPKFEKRVELLGLEWATKLKEEMNKDYFTKLGSYVATERRHFNIYPEPKDVFRAFRETPYSKVRVVVVGQDPYPQPSFANGLAFSSNRDLPTPYSLKNIFEEIERDLDTTIVDQDPDLRRWTHQGVLLLNRVLTVRENKPGSHKNIGWETFTTEVIRQLNKFPTPLIFILWGNDAQEVESLIDRNYHHVIKGAHPASERYTTGGFFGKKYFTRTNKLLEHYYHKQISW